MITYLCRHTPEISLAERLQLRISNVGYPRCGYDCDRRLASAGQRRGSHVDLAGPQRLGAGSRNRLSDPDGFPSLGVPTYPGLRIALPNPRRIAARIETASPDAIHIATEGPIGWAARAYCRRRNFAFTTSYTTRFPEYIAVRSIIPAAFSYAVLRHFHAAAAMTMIATPRSGKNSARKVSEGSAPGREASTPNSSSRTTRPSLICRGLFS